MRAFYSLIAILLLAQLTYGQQYPDRHNTSIHSSWISCQAKINPNPERGESHWIQYSLDTTYLLGASKFWNLNTYEYTTSGVSDVVIDYSLDGVNWMEWGDFSLEKAEALSTYEGIDGPDFEGLVARYLLITSTGNHGGDCHGFSEFRVASKPAEISNIADAELPIGITAQPNPFSQETKLLLDGLPDGLLTYRLTDALGRVVQNGNVTGDQLLIPGDELAGGVYTITIIHSTGTKSKQLTRIK